VIALFWPPPYSTGVRRRELARLEIDDLNRERQTIHVRQGKGHKDRVAERMNTNAQHCPVSRCYASQGFAKVPRSLALAPRSTSNAQPRTQEANTTARMAHLSLLVLFGSALDVRCSMFD